ncbi:MAG: guanylate kinase [Nitrospirae bacterium]|nr:guanylate kinase [Nitrospirota bacterium]
MPKGRGNLFVVSAPSGAGKTTLCRELVMNDHRLRHLVSHTTRQPRPGEVDGRDYTFIDEAAFRRMVDEDRFAEWAQVHGNYYGTALDRLTGALEAGDDVLMDIDVQGARQIRKRDLDGVFIFIAPPSMEELERRLRNRRSDSDDVIRRRLAKARDELSCLNEYDYLVLNDMFEQALDELRCIIMAARLRVGYIPPGYGLVT